MSYLTKTEKTYFYFGLFLKILLGSFLASHFLTELFIPFINYFVESGFSDPYSFFYEKNSANTFPYPALMLYINELTIWMRLVLHIPFIPVVGGLGYEVLKLTAKYRNNILFMALAKPGLWLQNIYTL